MPHQYFLSSPLNEILALYQHCKYISSTMDSGSTPRLLSYDRDYQSIEAFVTKFKPSLVTLDDVEWLTICRVFSRQNEDVVDTSGLELAWENLCLSSLDQVTIQDVEKLANAHKVLHGKWMIFANSKEVDDMWARVALGVVNDGLAIDVKVSTSHVKLKLNGQPEEEKIPHGHHVICVWSHDFTNIDDVFALQACLRCLGFLDRLLYKLDAYSICGLYEGNRLGLPAVKFRA